MEMYSDFKKNENFFENDETIVDNFKKNNKDYSKKYNIKKPRFALSKIQRDELLEKSIHNPIHYLMIRLQMECGLRVGEICNLIVENLFLIDKHPYIKIKSHPGTAFYSAWSPKTKSGNRIVPIDIDLAISLKFFIGNIKNRYVFISRKHTNYKTRSVNDFINGYAKKCKSIGTNIGSHTLRRTWASFQIKEGTPIGTLSKKLGHKDIKTTMIYLFDIEDIEVDKEIANLSGKMHSIKGKNINEKLKKINMK